MRPPYLRISEIDTIVAPHRLEDVGGISRSPSFPIQTYGKFGLFTHAGLFLSGGAIGKPFLYAFVGVAAHATTTFRVFPTSEHPKNHTIVVYCVSVDDGEGDIIHTYPYIIAQTYPIVDLIQGITGLRRSTDDYFSLSAPKTTEPRWIGSFL
jgi:hypothetical protein